METFEPDSVCAEKIKFQINEEGIIEEVEFIGGCTGNLSGIASLVKGADIETVVERLEGISCRNNTSCPDQLSKALKEAI